MNKEERPLPPFTSDWDIKDAVRWPPSPPPRCAYDLARFHHDSILFIDQHPSYQDHNNSYVVPNVCTRCLYYNYDCNRAYPRCKECSKAGDPDCTPQFLKQDGISVPYRIIHLLYDYEKGRPLRQDLQQSSHYADPHRVGHFQQTQCGFDDGSHTGQKRGLVTGENVEYGDAKFQKRRKTDLFGTGRQIDWVARNRDDRHFPSDYQTSSNGFRNQNSRYDEGTHRRLTRPPRVISANSPRRSSSGNPRETLLGRLGPPTMKPPLSPNPVHGHVGETSNSMVSNSPRPIEEVDRKDSIDAMELSKHEPEHPGEHSDSRALSYDPMERDIIASIVKATLLSRISDASPEEKRAQVPILGENSKDIERELQHPCTVNSPLADTSDTGLGTEMIADDNISPDTTLIKPDDCAIEVAASLNLDCEKISDASTIAPPSPIILPEEPPLVVVSLPEAPGIELPPSPPEPQLHVDEDKISPKAVGPTRAKPKQISGRRKKKEPANISLQPTLVQGVEDPSPEEVRETAPITREEVETKHVKSKSSVTRAYTKKSRQVIDDRITTLKSLNGKIIPLVWSDTWQEMRDSAPYFLHFLDGFSFTNIEMEAILIDGHYGIVCSKWINEEVHLSIRRSTAKSSKFPLILKRLEYNQECNLPLCLAASDQRSGVPFTLPVPYSIFGLFMVEEIIEDEVQTATEKGKFAHWNLQLRAIKTDANRWWKSYVPTTDPSNSSQTPSTIFPISSSSRGKAILQGLKQQAKEFQPLDYYTCPASEVANVNVDSSVGQLTVYSSIPESWVIPEMKDEGSMIPEEFIENLFAGSRCRECGKLGVRTFWTFFECSCCGKRRKINQMNWHPQWFQQRHTLTDGIRRYGCLEKGLFTREMTTWRDRVWSFTYTFEEENKRIRVAHVISSGNSSVLGGVADILNDVATIPNFSRPTSEVTGEAAEYYYYGVGEGEPPFHDDIPLIPFDDTQRTGEKVTLPLTEYMVGCAGRTFLADGVSPWDMQLLFLGTCLTPVYVHPEITPDAGPSRLVLTVLGGHCEVMVHPEGKDIKSRLLLELSHGDFVVVESTCKLKICQVKRRNFGILVLGLWNSSEDA